jgi:DNA topoisomerase-2
MDISKKYQKLTSIEHILLRPGMYIGGVDEIEDSLWVSDKISDNNTNNTDKIIYKQIKYSPGLYKIFDEILVNAYDQTIRDKTVTKIKIDIDQKNNKITVYNNGVGIDVVIHPKEKIYVPELIFAHLRTSTSFDKDNNTKDKDNNNISITGGIHGYGAKLTAIFSKKFNVEVGDIKNKKKFSQYYKNNLSFKSTPNISPFNLKEGYVKITFEPDLNYFKLKELSDDIVSLMVRRVYDIAGLVAPHVKIYLNNNKIIYNTFEKYITLYTQQEQIKETCDPSSIKFDQKRWKVIVTKSDGHFRQLSFVNSIWTNNGGRHVDYILNRIIKDIKDRIETKYKTTKIRSQFIKDNIWIFISSVIENPMFSSQTKDELMTPVNKFGSTCEFSSGFIKKIFDKLNFDTLITQQIKFMENVEITKLDKKPKKTLLGIKKLYDANYAGTKKSLQCTLILTEGDSAKTMAISGLSVIKNSNNTYGVFPLKGKLLNVREATHSQIINNEEFKNLKLIIGLQVNKIYNDENINELRYRSILLMMDADVDGSHIKGLFINMIHYFWPSLLKIKGFIKVFITPVIKISQLSQKSKTTEFYNIEDYNKWKKSNINTKVKHNIKYYKGLGTNTPTEAKEYFGDLNKHIIDFVWVESTDSTIQMAFEKSKADDRKVWLKKYDREETLDYTQNNVTYKDFINKELIHFSNYDNIRSVPSLLDGLKPSQRKVLYATFKRNLTTDMKVAQFVGYASEHTSYHHGEASMINTVISMAQNFVGSNNINVLDPSGQFGTRLMGGKDHSSARYIFTKLNDITRLIYHKDDDHVLNYLDDDGFKIEPDFYVPIIPMVLVNGCEGIGTGYSTYVPKFNPIDIINNILTRLKNQKIALSTKSAKSIKFTKLTPWYRGFTGKIIKEKDNMYLTKGIFIKSENTIRITELPLTFWTESYKFFLDTVIIQKEYVSSIINNSTDTTVDFIIKFNDVDLLKKLTDSEIEKLFGLTKVINLTNMYLHSSNNNELKLYKNTTQIMEEFYVVRLEYYKKRKDYLLKKLNDEIMLLENKVKFMNLIIQKKLDIFGKPKEVVEKLLTNNKLLKIDGNYDYLINMFIVYLTKEKVDEFTGLLNNKTKLYNSLKNKKIEDIWSDDLIALKNYYEKN